MNNIDSIAIVGSGVVGLATGQALSSLGHDVVYVDVSAARREQLLAMGLNCAPTLELGRESTVIFVAVPTPSNGDEYDLSILDAAMEDVGRALAESDARHVVATRSTVPPLTAERRVTPILERTSGKREGEGFDVASAPEFLRQATALMDAMNPTMTVVGARNTSVRDRIMKLFAPLGGEHRAFDDPATTEMIKIVHNCYNAAKISFFNEIHSIATASGLSSGEVIEVVVRSAEAQRNPDYGTRGGYAYGGACLPKDMDGLIGFATSIDVEVPLLNAVRQVNDTLEKLSAN